MTDELQRATVTGRTQGHIEPLIVGHGDTTIAQPAQVTEPPLSDGEAARVSVDVCREYERRLCELEERVEALSKELESVIMTLSKMSRHFTGLAVASGSK